MLPRELASIMNLHILELNDNSLICTIPRELGNISISFFSEVPYRYITSRAGESHEPREPVTLYQFFIRNDISEASEHY